MGSKSWINRNTIIIIAIFSTLAAIMVAVGVILIFLYFLPHEDDINRIQAIAIAKKDFGCDKVLWVNSNAVALSNEPENKLNDLVNRSHWVYFVVGEKDGVETYILIPSEPNRINPFVTAWVFDYSFSQIVDKFNECGAQYVYDPTKDFDNMTAIAGSSLKKLTGYDDDGVDGETFYERLDVKAVFHYYWYEDDILYNCIVTQESGELKAYKK